MESFVLFFLCIFVLPTIISAYSAEFNAIRGLNVISAVDNKPKDLSKSILAAHPSDSVLICFRSFG